MKRLIAIIAFVSSFCLQAIYGPESQAQQNFADEIANLAKKIANLSFGGNAQHFSQIRQKDRELAKKFETAFKTSENRKIFRFENTASIAVMDALDILPRNCLSRKAAIEFLWFLTRYDEGLQDYCPDVDSEQNAQDYIRILAGIEKFKTTLVGIFTTHGDIDDSDAETMRSAFYLLYGLCCNQNMLAKFRESKSLKEKVEKLLQHIPHVSELFAQANNFLEKLSGDNSDLNILLSLPEEDDDDKSQQPSKKQKIEDDL